MTNWESHINLAILGHTGCGKSTLMGHLLEAHDEVGADMMAEVTKLSTEAGCSDLRYAWLVNNTPGERERGLTIDVHPGKLETSKYRVNMLDMPGHRDFIKNTIVGMSEADCAVLVVSATRREFRKSIKDDGSGMIPEHALLAFTFGVTQMIVCVNKMDDSTVKYSQERFEKVKARVQKHLKKIGFKLEEVPFIPTSAWNADNLKTKSGNMSWWKGAKISRTSGQAEIMTLIDALDAMEVPPGREKLRKKALRIPIRDMYNIEGAAVAVGRVESGQLKPGSKLLFGPIPGEGTVLSVQKDHTSIECARPRDVIGIMLKTDCTNVNRGRHGMFRRGQVCTDIKGEPLKIVKEFIAQVVILEHPKGIIHEGYSPILDVHTTHVQCKIKQFLQKLKRTTGEVVAEKPKKLSIGDAANVRMVPLQPMCAEQFRKYPKLGRFSMRDLSRVVGVGVITKITEYETVKSIEDTDVENREMEHAMVNEEDEQDEVEKRPIDPAEQQAQMIQQYSIRRNKVFI